VAADREAVVREEVAVPGDQEDLADPEAEGSAVAAGGQAGVAGAKAVRGEVVPEAEGPAAEGAEVAARAEGKKYARACGPRPRQPAYPSM